MATTATTIKAKLETTITGLTVAADSEKFEIMREDEDEGSIVTSANERRFEIFHFGGEDRVGESADAGYHHPTEGTVTERFQIAVFYPFKKDHRAQDSAIREDVQKIKTVGDQYMAVAGIGSNASNSKRRSHLVDLINCVLEVRFA